VTSKRTLCCIRGPIGERDATRIARPAAGWSSPLTARRLHYPYYWFTFRSTASTILGPSRMRVACLVDGRTGLFATSDPFDIVTRSVPREDVLDHALGEAEADAVARRGVPHAIQARRRSLVAEHRELLDCRLVYKPFWVVTGETARVLVDGVTGAVFPLAGVDEGASWRVRSRR
jgi:hypothetical protein